MKNRILFAIEVLLIKEPGFWAKFFTFFSILLCGVRKMDGFDSFRFRGILRDLRRKDTLKFGWIMGGNNQRGYFVSVEKASTLDILVHLVQKPVLAAPATLEKGMEVLMGVSIHTHVGSLTGTFVMLTSDSEATVVC
jgi:hypothetical protein